jgi:hydrogenase expression/formation protein HypC
MAAPSRVVELADGCAIVEAFGQRRTVSLLLLDEGSVHVGDYLLIQAGGYAYEKVEIDRAHEALATMQALMQDASQDQRQWGSDA